MSQATAAFSIRSQLMLIVVLFFSVFVSHAQMRKLYMDPDQSAYSYLCKLSFYSPSQGFVAFTGWVGFTSDSGRTFTRRPVTLSNVDYNSYSVNLTFGFDIMGIKAFDKNSLLLYGNYGAVPAILYSFDGGITYKLIFQSQATTQLSLTNGVADMDFAPNTNTGFAVDEDRILRTADKGLTWSAIYTSVHSYYNYVQAIDANNVFVGSTYGDAASILQKTINGGVSWQALSLPTPTSDARLRSVYFLSASTGWILMVDNGTGYFYKTTNGGASWSQLNNVNANPFPALRMKFIDNNTGYAVDGGNTVYKTSNGGAVWEPLQRDNNVTSSVFVPNDVQLMGSNQLWAGWAGMKMLEISTNAGGIPLPKSYFFIDTAGLGVTSKVTLTNYSASTYTYQWLLNGALISTNYNSSYQHDEKRLKDTITLIVSNGIYSDTTTSYASFNPPILPVPAPSIVSFSPASGATGDYVSITGTNFYVNDTKPTVTIGGVPVETVYVYSSSLLNVIVGEGASGAVVVKTPGGSATAIGTFIYIPPPSIASFSPASATLGDVVTIKGSHFTGATAVRFGDTAVRSFTVVSDSLITATVWLGASGTVKVTRPSGTGQANGFTYIPPPAPTIRSLSAYSGTAGTPVKLMGQHFYGTLSVKFGGTEANSFTVVSDTEIDAVVGFSISGNVTVTTLFGSGSIDGFTIVPPPVITSFSPTIGPIGTAVTISGTNFSSTATQNVVFFGSVKATVTAATTTQLTVQVPYGAAYQPISVTVKNLTAYSMQPFLVTSPGAVRTLTDSSFNEKKDYPSGGYYKGNVAIADFDGDGKPDLANSMGSNGSNVSVSRNSSSPGVVLFQSPLYFATDYFPLRVTPCDLDGDGKPDLVVATQTLQVLKNTSSGLGNISFANALTIKGLYHPGNVVTADLNGDGKPELIVVHTDNNSVKIFGNISTPDTIAFARPVNVSFGPSSLSGGIAISDIDGDGKPDITVALSYSGFVVLRNTGTNRNFSFEPSPTFIIHSYWSTITPKCIAAGDLDGDGKPDLVIGLGTEHAFTVLRNTSIPGNISFASQLDFGAGNNFTSSVSIEDLDGDGKADITVNNPENYGVWVFKNTSLPGNLFFNKKLKCGGVYATIGAVTGDLDGDGKPDIATNNNDNYTALSVLHNRSGVNTTPVIADTNYTVQAVNVTCRNKNDGKIIVTLAQAFSYQIKLTGAGIADSVHFAGTRYERDKLPAGIYQLCFTIDGYPGYQQCFTVNITQPKDLSAYFRKTASGASDSMIKVTLEGSDVYTINVNGNRFQTNSSTLTLPLQTGINTITVQTPLACQGTITQTFYVPGDSVSIKLIPNPVTTWANLYLPGTDAEVWIEVASLDGKVIERKRTYTVGSDRSVRLDVSRYASGVYLVYVTNATLNASVKLVKTQ